MTDDGRRRGRDDEDFGPPLFGDDPTDEVRAIDLSFDDDSSAMPHWTDPPTGDLPRILTPAANAADPTDDVDVWSSFSGSQPVWRDEPAADPSGGLFDDEAPLEQVAVGRQPAAFDEADDLFDADLSAPTGRPGRITIGTDPTDAGSRPPVGRKPRPNGRPARPGAPAAPVGGRNMPVAVGVGVGLAAVFVVALRSQPWAVLAIIVAVLALAAIEFFEKVAEKGYQPAVLVGVLVCATLPVAAYYMGFAGERVLPLGVFLAFAAGAVTFIGAKSIDCSPLANMAITSLGVVWIGVLGSYAVLILNWSNNPASSIGTDTLFLLALGVVANDVGALFVGSVVGKTPLRPWISPNKTVQGLLGGTLATVLVMALVHLTDRVDTWSSLGDLLILGLVVAIFAPIGDLTESMFKRNLDVKDFGTMVAGHGGVLDRFDGFLFTLPAVYYVTLMLEPWMAAVGG